MKNSNTYSETADAMVEANVSLGMDLETAKKGAITSITNIISNTPIHDVSSDNFWMNVSRYIIL